MPWGGPAIGDVCPYWHQDPYAKTAGFAAVFQLDRSAVHVQSHLGDGQSKARATGVAVP